MTESARDLLLEIGTEELPARFCVPALEQLQSKAAVALNTARLPHGKVETFGTPRRLVLLVQAVAMQQHDLEMTTKGPPARIAYDAEGKPTKALEGFMRTQGVTAEQVYVAREGNADYIFARRVEVGGSIGLVLPDLLKNLVLSLEFPKSMRWGSRSIRFARPIKWLLALLGNSRVPFDVDGITAGATTFGHRFLAPPEPILVFHPRDYFQKVGNAYVLVDQGVREDVIWQKVREVARDLGGMVKPDPDLLEEVTWLVEQPWAFAGSFDASYLEIPKEVLVTSMREHQRYFPVYDAAGERLLPYFIAVRNGLDAHLDTVRAGNEKVLRARLADARFFFDEDRRVGLEPRNEKLKHIVFQEKLGTLYEKVERVEGLAKKIARFIRLNAADTAHAQRAAHLCKADLATAMVYEFPELQGVMGREYARLEGEDPAVATAIYEHYLPRGAGDALPQTPAGVIVALADKLDTLAGYFCLGLIPKGSADPFALRRAAQGVIAIMIEHNALLQHQDLWSLCEAAVDRYAALVDGADRKKVVEDLSEFLKAREKVQLEQRGIRHDVIDAVLATDRAIPAMNAAVAEALSSLLQDPDFAAVMAAFKRVANLGAKAESSHVDPKLFTEDQERDLWQAAQEFMATSRQLAFEEKYADFFRAALPLKGPVDAFLDKVLVMAEDPAVRRNRLALLLDVAHQLCLIADLSKLVLA